MYKVVYSHILIRIPSGSYVATYFLIYLTTSLETILILLDVISNQLQLALAMIAIHNFCIYTHFLQHNHGMYFYR